MTISGLYENCVATRDVAVALRYWREFGFRPVAEGALDAARAGRLYGYASGLRSVRLQNGDSRDHGLVRVLAWDQARDEGLGTAPPLTVGGRWFIHNTRDIWYVYDAFDDARQSGEPWVHSVPSRAVVGGTGKIGTSVLDRPFGVRELMVLGPETRQAFFQRYGYERKHYGVIPPDSPMGTSEATHSSYIVRDDSHGAFYVEALGLEVINELHESGGDKAGNADTLMMEREQRFTIMGFRSPGHEVGLIQFYRPLWETPDLFPRSRPGSLGLSLSTFRVAGLAAYRERVVARGATEVTEIVPNEFGEATFSFVAPDRVFWTLIEA